MRAKLIACFLAAALLAGCAGAGTGGQGQNTPPAQNRTLTVYTPHPENVYKPVIKEFQERTGIWVFVETGGSGELAQRISEEADNPVCDVLFGGGADTHEAYKQFFTPYQSPAIDAVDEAYRSADDSWTAFSVLPAVIIYNAKLLEVREVPTGWTDLLDPALKGKIAFTNPAVSGSCFTALCTIMQAVDGDPWQTITSFAENMDGKMLSSSTEIHNSVAQGKHWIGITWEELAFMHLDNGADIGVVYPEEGTSLVPDAAAIVKNAPNTEEARLFIDFIISHDVQQMVAQEFKRRSVLKGAKPPEGMIATSEINAIQYDYDWCNTNRAEILERWKREF